MWLMLLDELGGPGLGSTVIIIYFAVHIYSR